MVVVSYEESVMSETTGLRAINSDQIGSVIRQVATAIAGSIAARGFIADSEAELWGGVIAAVLIAAWGYFANRDAALINSATQVPAVTEMVVEPAAVDSLNTKKETSRKLTAGRGQPYR
jgi:hypothetical protein